MPGSPRGEVSGTSQSARVWFVVTTHRPGSQPNSGHPYPLYMFGVVIYPAWDLGAVHLQSLWYKEELL